MEQLAASLMNASLLMQIEKIRLAASCYPQACCKLFTQFAASLWITSLDKSDKTTCSKSVKIRLVAT
jgi:hypothetical protein